MDDAKELLAVIQRHIERTGQSESGFGRKVMSDPNFVADLRRGRQPTRRTIKKVRAATALATSTIAIWCAS